MKHLILLMALTIFAGFMSNAQDQPGPGPGGQQQAQQAPDLLIPVSTSIIDLVYRVNGRDGRVYQAYLGRKLSTTESLLQSRDAGHPAYPTHGTDNLFEAAIRMTHNDGNPSLELKYVSHTTHDLYLVRRGERRGKPQSAPLGN